MAKARKAASSGRESGGRRRVALAGGRKEVEARDREPAGVRKAPTGIRGFDEITGGGLPAGRPTLVAGGAGCGKTLFGMEFLVRGATAFGEPGVFVSFEESLEELAENVASLGFDLADLEARGLLAMDHVKVERSEIAETGEYDLEGLFLRLGWAIDSVGAKRVVLDTLETLFASLSNESILRAELRRLFRWLKDRGVTAVITGERGEGSLTRQGLEEYVSDCVILLDHRVRDEISTRRLRVVKYRGSTHGTNEYPFLIDERGFSILPVTSLELKHPAPTDRISSGVPSLDQMLDGQGFLRGSSVLVSGTAGTGKSSLAAHFADAACRRGERCLYFAFEESPDQVLRNMRSIGIDLEPWVERGLLRFHASRPTFYGLEMHLVSMHREIEDFQPDVAVVDPITNLTNAGTTNEVRSTLMRLVDFLKAQQVTSLFTSLTGGEGPIEATELGISSLMDTWLLVRSLEMDGERNRALYVLKARGIAHSNQVREFLLTDHGADLVDVYIAPEGVLVGSARLVRQQQEEEDAQERQREAERRRAEIERKRLSLEAQVASLRAELEVEEGEVRNLLKQDEERGLRARARRQTMATSRGSSGRSASEPTTRTSTERSPR